MQKSFKPYKLVIFDLDGTLVHPWTTHLIPGVRLALKRLRAKNKAIKFAIVTNKGNIGLKYWRTIVRKQGGDIGDPNQNGWTIESTLEAVNQVANEIDAKAYLSFAYKSQEGNWSPTPTGAEDDPRWSQEWRKPNPGMLKQAMIDADATPDQTVMIGNSNDDLGAAEAAGIDYISVEEFLPPHAPRIVITYCPQHSWDWLTMRDEVDQAATVANYEEMLRSCARIYDYPVELRTRKTPGPESFRIINSIGEESDRRIIGPIRKNIKSEWIDRKWIKFSSVEAHLDALMDGFPELLVVAPVYMRNLYTKEALEAAAEKFEEAEAYKQKFRFVIG